MPSGLETILQRIVAMMSKGSRLEERTILTMQMKLSLRTRGNFGIVLPVRCRAGVTFLARSQGRVSPAYARRSRGRRPRERGRVARPLRRGCAASGVAQLAPVSRVGKMPTMLYLSQPLVLFAHPTRLAAGGVAQFAPRARAVRTTD
jgi:hypothetical protein